jgi:hypothetical protein
LSRRELLFEFAALGAAVPHSLFAFNGGGKHDLWVFFFLSLKILSVFLKGYSFWAACCHDE